VLYALHVTYIPQDPNNQSYGSKDQGQTVCHSSDQYQVLPILSVRCRVTAAAETSAPFERQYNGE